MASSWLRTRGNSGWYSESYGGGIYMTDTSWIRTYGGKPFYCDN
ncbi:shufflon system plasmid conjugative transfer pilus tip adhesin PilV [Catenibacterium sp.]